MMGTSAGATVRRTGQLVPLVSDTHRDRDAPLRVRLDDAISYLGPYGVGTITGIAPLPHLPGDAGRSLVVSIRDHDIGPGRDSICVPHWRVDARDTVDPREVLALFRRLYGSPASGVGPPAPDWQRHRRGFLEHAILAGGVLFLDAPTAGLMADRKRLFWEHVAALAIGGRTIILVAADHVLARERNARRLPGPLAAATTRTSSGSGAHHGSEQAAAN